MLTAMRNAHDLVHQRPYINSPGHVEVQRIVDAVVRGELTPEEALERLRAYWAREEK